MSEVFGQNYASAYDALYQEKDYDGECALLEKLFKRYADGAGVHSLLDLGCGTGSHAYRLAAKGYQVVGVDRSAEMLRVAAKKAQDHGTTIPFHEGDIRRLKVGGTFDACVIMFAVLGYQIENDDVLAALRGAREHVRKGGLLAFDVWYGPAVLNQQPGERTRVIETDKGLLLRNSVGRLDTTRHLCTVDYRVWQIREKQLESATQESHQMRYFFPQELKLFLQVSGFELLRLGGFPDFERDPNDSTWNVMAVARAV